MFASTNQSARRHNSEEPHESRHRRENLKSYVLFVCHARRWQRAALLRHLMHRKEYANEREERNMYCVKPFA